MEEFYKKKIIRDFLTLFSESKWKNLCILCMEYGVLTLKQKYQVSSLSMEDIEEFVNDLIEEESKKNQKNLKKLRQGIISNTNFNYNNNNIYSNSMANNTSTSFKPSSDWRKGEVKTIFDNEDPNKIFNINAQEQNLNLNNNINNYHYKKNNENGNIKINDNNNYIEPTTVSNEEPAFIKKGKDKLIDDILFPKQNKIVNYRKDNLFNNNLPKKQQLKQYKTSYNESYGNKKKNNINNYSNVNSKYKNYNDYNNTSFTEGISFNASKTLKRSSSFSNNTRFKSGLQKLKMTKPLNKMNNDDPMNNSFSIRANYSNKINNVPSKIKSQVDADKKIYGLLKNNKNQGNKYY
jgi:hypothetical protein